MIDELMPGTTYHYTLFRTPPNFTARSLIGTGTAWSEDGLDPVRIAIMACIGQGSVLPDFSQKARK